MSCQSCLCSSKAYGICNTCKPAKYLCLTHLHDHEMLQCEIIIMPHAEILEKIKLQKYLEKKSKKEELLAKIKGVENNFTMKSSLLISEIVKHFNEVHSIIKNQMNEVYNSESNEEHDLIINQLEEISAFHEYYKIFNSFSICDCKNCSKKCKKCKINDNLVDVDLKLPLGYESINCLECLQLKKCKKCNDVFPIQNNDDTHCENCKYLKCKNCETKVKYSTLEDGYCKKCLSLENCNSCSKLYKRFDLKNGKCEICSPIVPCLGCHKEKNVTEFKDGYCESCLTISCCSNCKNLFYFIQLTDGYCQNCSSQIVCISCKKNFKTLEIINGNCQQCRYKEFTTLSRSLDNKFCESCKVWKIISEFSNNQNYCNRCMMKMNNQFLNCKKCNQIKNISELSEYQYCCMCMNYKSVNFNKLKENTNICLMCKKYFPGFCNDSDQICKCEKLCSVCLEENIGYIKQLNCKHKICKDCWDSGYANSTNSCNLCPHYYICPKHPTKKIPYTKNDETIDLNCCAIRICSVCKSLYEDGHYCLGNSS